MDIVCTVPQQFWWDWLDEGDCPGEPWDGGTSHFWLPRPLPAIAPGERVYIVAFGRLRGYAPLIDTEPFCTLQSSVGCLMRRDGAVAVTIPEPIRGFRGWRARWWDRAAEVPFPDWRTAGVPDEAAFLRGWRKPARGAW